MLRLSILPVTSDVAGVSRNVTAGPDLAIITAHQSSAEAAASGDGEAALARQTVQLHAGSGGGDSAIVMLPSGVSNTSILLYSEGDDSIEGTESGMIAIAGVWLSRWSSAVSSMSSSSMTGAIASNTSVSSVCGMSQSSSSSVLDHPSMSAGDVSGMCGVRVLVHDREESHVSMSAGGDVFWSVAERRK